MAAAKFLALALCALAVAVVDANNCCTAPLNGWASSGHCNLVKCLRALEFTAQSDLIEFLDGCRAHQGLTYVVSTMTCAAPGMSRSYYSNLVFADSRYTQEFDPSVREAEARIAAFVLGYGCMGQSTTAACRALQSSGFENTTTIFGQVAPQSENSGVTYTAELFRLVRECLMSEVGTFAQSEFSSGASHCAATGSSSVQASIHGLHESSTINSVVGRDITVCDLCRVTEGAVPFCSAQFTRTSRGLRCSTNGADRIARAFHQRWVRDELANISSVSVVATSAVCKNTLREVACETSLAMCTRSATSMSCRHTCEQRFEKDCNVSSAEAQIVCRSLGSTSTSSPCPTTHPTAAPTTSPTVEDPTYTLEEAAPVSSTASTEMTVEHCHPTADSFWINFLVSEYTSTVRRLTNGSSQVVSSAVVAQKGNDTCPHVSRIVIVSTKAVVAQESEQLVDQFSKGPVAAAATVTSRRVAQSYTKVSGSSNSAASAASVSVLALLMAAMAAVMQF